MIPWSACPLCGACSPEGAAGCHHTPAEWREYQARALEPARELPEYVPAGSRRVSGPNRAERRRRAAIERKGTP